jgi:hypothetical protein
MCSKIRQLPFVMEAVKEERVRMWGHKDPDRLCIEGKRRIFRERAKCSQNEMHFFWW